MNANTAKVTINPNNVLGTIVGKVAWSMMGPYSLVSALLIGAKIASKIDASWFAVTSLVWGPFALALALGVVFGVIFGITLGVIATVDAFKMHARRKENARKLELRKFEQSKRAAAEETRRAQMLAKLNERQGQHV